MSSKKRNTRHTLLKCGLEIIAEHGIEKMTISSLCVQLGLTKGSFYHHFKDRKHFHASLLEFWMEENTERKKILADKHKTPEEQYAQILEYAATLPHELEKAIRAWAMQDPLAAQYQIKADTSRITYLANLLEKLLPDKNQAEMMARIVLATMIGSRHLFPPLMDQNRHEIMNELHSLMGIKLPNHMHKEQGGSS